MTLVWVGVMTAGLAIAVGASRQAVTHATTLVTGTRLPPFVVGLTLLAVGTDLPEIANSIIASFSGHGDLNIGDSVGSAATQATLVLGLLPLIAGAFVVGRRRVVRVGTVTIAALLIGVLLLGDGSASRVDAIVFIGLWLTGSLFVWRDLPAGSEPSIRVDYGQRARHAGAALVALIGVGAGASAAVWAFVQLAETLSVPEYVLAFFVASLGTSLPELIVNMTALRRGERDLAIGGVLGASFVDSTLSIAAGPLLAPTVVTADLAMRGGLMAAGAIAIVVLVLARHRRHNRMTGVLFLAIYAGFFLVMAPSWTS